MCLPLDNGPHLLIQEPLNGTFLELLLMRSYPFTYLSHTSRTLNLIYLNGLLLLLLYLQEKHTSSFGVLKTTRHLLPGLSLLSSKLTSPITSNTRTHKTTISYLPVDFTNNNRAYDINCEAVYEYVIVQKISYLYITL